MAASPQLNNVIQILRERKAKPPKTTDEARLRYEMLVSSFQIDDDIHTEKVGAGGVAAEWIVAAGAENGSTLLYLHGGGYVMGSIRSHREMLSRVSKAAGSRVLALDYRLAPEFSFPAPVDDTVAAYRWLLSKGTDPKTIVIGGDSAGGGLMVSALVALRYLGEPTPAAGVGLSAWTDMEATGQSFAANAESDPFVDRELLCRIAKTYLAGKDPRAPLASPIHADLSGLPPLLLQVGSIETLLDDTTVLAKKAEEAGVEVKVDVWDDMPHVWQQFAAILPEGQQAIERIGEFMRKHTG
jgi:monoterpene epsilon-lactone hydrolase